MIEKQLFVVLFRNIFGKDLEYICSCFVAFCGDFLALLSFRNIYFGEILDLYSIITCVLQKENIMIEKHYPFQK